MATIGELWKTVDSKKENPLHDVADLVSEYSSSDLISLDEAGFTSLVESLSEATTERERRKLKQHAIMFYRVQLPQWANVPRPRQSRQLEEIIEYDKPNEIGVLDLSGKLVSLDLKGINPLRSTLEEYGEKLDVEFKKKIRILRLSGNFLRDADMHSVLQFCKENMPFLLAVDLSSNRIQGEEHEAKENILKILKMDTVRHVDISVNPVATISGKEFFKGLNDEQWKKLIWIPKQWLHAGNWQSVLPDDTTKVRKETIKNNHLNYYATRPHCA